MIYPSSAQFITSAANIGGAPEFAMSEVAFLGRSNVGKSSLINALTGRKNLAKSSSTPGKTQLINFFEVKFKKRFGGFWIGSRDRSCGGFYAEFRAKLRIKFYEQIRAKLSGQSRLFGSCELGGKYLFDLRGSAGVWVR